ncbi:MAG: hypothetical protein KAR11_05550 [Phycisphaerae bacterium]|nr:hypothetical protein [Phycisphaerae bacterium]
MITTNKIRKTQRMYDTGMRPLIFGLFLCMVFTLPIIGQEKSDKTVKPYVDTLNGFSILPPKDGVLNPEKNPKIIAEWFFYTPKTKRIEWSFRVTRVLGTGSHTDIQSFADEFARQLTKQKKTKILNEKVSKISGRDAIEVSGITEGKIDGELRKVYFRRVWVRTTFEKIEIDMSTPQETPKEKKKDKVTLVNAEFLSFELVAPLDNRDIIDAIWEKSVGSLKIMDVEKTLTQLKENSERAKGFLQDLWKNKGLAQISDKPMWYLVSVKDKPVGWVMMQIKPVRRNYIDGFELRLCSMRNESKDRVSMGRQQLFVDPKLEGGFWKIYTQVGSGKDSGLSSQEGLVQWNKIVCSINKNGRIEAREKEVPEEVRIILLPKAVGLLFPQLVDLTKHNTGYTFAEYSSDKNTFNMRTFTVVGPEWINVRGKRTLAIKMTDQPYLAAEPAVLWLGKDGMILRCNTGSSTIESAMKKQVLAYFPQADAYVKAINQLGKTKKKVR